MMQRRFFYTGFFAMVFMSVASILSAQTEVKKWSFQTNGKVEASVQVSNDTLFIGSKDSTFYALDTLGELIWKVKIPYQIKSTAAFNASTVYFEAGNRLYALKKSTGEEIWEHEPSEVVGKDVKQNFDNWDLKGPSPLLDGETLYYGNQFGSVYGINAKTGMETFHFNTNATFAIRTKPAIANDTIYFADWDGYVYAISLSSGDLLWSYHTYEGTKPYPQFGPIIGEMVVVEEMLMCGIRNHEYQVFNRKTGEIAWEYNSGGTWLSGIPVVLNDTLYLGTSDTHLLMAMNPENGDIYWHKSVELGVYNKPAFYNNLIVVAAGDEQMTTSTGKGVIMIIDKEGDMVNAVSLNSSCFNSPTMRKNDLYIGTYSGEVVCFDLLALTHSKTDSISTDIVAFSGGTLPNDALITEDLGYIKNVGTDTIMLRVDIDESELPSGAVRVVLEEQVNVADSTLMQLRIIQSLLEDGDYRASIEVMIPENTSLSYNIPVSFTVETGSSSAAIEKKSEMIKVYPNPATDLATIELNLESGGLGEIFFFDMSGKQIDFIPVELTSGNIQIYQWEINTNIIAFYKVIINDEEVGSGKILIQ